MMRILLIISLCFVQPLQAQFRYTFSSVPDSAAVYLNEELECYTPCRVNFFWRNAVDDKLTFSVRADGYESWSDTIRHKPLDFDYSKYAYLDKKFNRLELSGTPLIDFDKLLVNFENGRMIGSKKSLKGEVTPYKWEGSIKVGDESFRNNFIKMATDIGYNTVISQSSKLFSSDRRREHKLPRYVVGVELIDYQLQFQQIRDRRSYVNGDMKARTEMSFIWKVMDKKSGHVVYDYTNTKSISTRQYFYQSKENYSDVYELALIDFLESEGFVNLVSSSSDMPLNVSSDTITKRAKLPMSIVQMPKFDQLSDMIKYVNPSCVTIITDGGHGSGAIISKEGLILSAYHVVSGVNQIDVKFSSGLTMQAEIVVYDEASDVVLLKIPGSGYRPLAISEDDEYNLGAEVITIGTPADVELGQSVSKGILSGKRKNDDQIYWQIDMAVSPGNSGGPLLNKEGQIIGVIQKKVIDRGVEGIGFALPIGVVKETFEMTF